MQTRRMPWRWGVWGVVAVPYLLAFFQRLALNTAGTAVRLTFHWNAAQFGLLAGTYFVAASVMRIPSGWVADRWGPRRLALVSMGLGAAGALLFSQSHSLAFATGARVLVAFGDSAIFVSLIRLQAEWFAPPEFATLSGLSLLMGGIGFWLTTTPLAALLQHASWRWVFLGIGFIDIILLIIAALVIPRRGSVDASGPFEARRDAHPPLGQQVTRILRNRRAWPPMLVFMALYSIWTVFGATWGIPYRNQVQHLSLIAAG